MIILSEEADKMFFKQENMSTEHIVTLMDELLFKNNKSFNKLDKDIKEKISLNIHKMGCYLVNNKTIEDNYDLKLLIIPIVFRLTKTYLIDNIECKDILDKFLSFNSFFSKTNKSSLYEDGEKVINFCYFYVGNLVEDGKYKLKINRNIVLLSSNMNKFQIN